MEKHTPEPANGSFQDVVAERADSLGKNPKRDTTLKCKGQTKRGKQCEQCEQCEQCVVGLDQNGYCHFHLNSPTPIPLLKMEMKKSYPRYSQASHTKTNRQHQLSSHQRRTNSPAFW